MANEPDRTPLLVGLHTAFWQVTSGIVRINPAFLDLDLDSIVADSSPPFLQFRTLVSQAQFPTECIEQFGQNAIKRGVATSVKERTFEFMPGCHINIAPPVTSDWKMLDATLCKEFRDTEILSQGLNTCWADAVFFLGLSFNLGRHQRDACTFSKIRQMTRTQLAYRWVISRISSGLSLKTKNQLRDFYIRIIASENVQITRDGFNDLGEVASLSWDGLYCLEYTYSSVFTCCRKRLLMSQKEIARRRTSHSIALTSPHTPGQRISNPDNTLHGGELCHGSNQTMAQMIEKAFFQCLGPKDVCRSDLGDMLTPYEKCPEGGQGCTQLLSKKIQIIGDLPRYLFVPIDHGSPVDHRFRKYLDPLEIGVFMRNEGKHVLATYHIVGLGLHRGDHFTCQVQNPPGIPSFVGKLIKFDGMKSASPVEVTQGKSGLLTGVNKSSRISLAIYELQENLVREDLVNADGMFNYL